MQTVIAISRGNNTLDAGKKMAYQIYIVLYMLAIKIRVNHSQQTNTSGFQPQHNIEYKNQSQHDKF